MKLSISLAIILLIAYKLTAQTNTQPTPAEAVKMIAYHDSIFWQAYNVCDVEKMSTYFTNDMEFYHDKGGPTFTLAKFKESMKTGLCGNPNWHLRREAVTGTVQAFPLHNYGGLISGEHIFYVKEAGKPEYLDGYGKFTQLWQFKDGQWKMSRILSYDHGPAEAKLKK